MKKKLLLTSFAVLSSIGLANAVCTPPTTLKCACQHPIIENGVLVCGPSYCGDKKCMPDGSCCETEKYCESSVGTQCCAEGQTCDATTGCVEEKDIEALCTEGQIYTSLDGVKICQSPEELKLDEAFLWCSDRGMKLADIYEICPTWDEDCIHDSCCSELYLKTDGAGTGITASTWRDGLPLFVGFDYGLVQPGGDIGKALCIKN